MSIIVAVERDGKKCIAENSLTLEGSRIIHESRSFGVQQYWDSLVGVTGWQVYHNILASFADAHDPMPMDSRLNIFKLMCKLWRFAKEELQFVNDQGDDSTQGPFADLDCSMIIANPHGIFQVFSNLEVDMARHYTAIGSGQQYAFGALSVLYDTGASAAEIAKRATEVATRWDQSCPGDARVLTVD